ncbi:methyltransferase family protein [Corynebacterium uterequi]|uniref:Methyltransferase family protein n=2 Tax=Corynebacterium uterequi TaxID=1072256 RepID=A0A0G3HA25_9CORY|nr:methyltransferase family protein [Corynebacterium uterequi]
MTAIQSRLDAYWSDRAASYQRYTVTNPTASQRRQIFERTLEPLLPASAQVLDVGTGTGYLAQLLADAGHRVTGIDTAAGMLDEARRVAATRPAEHQPTYLLGDATAPAFADASFDAVTSRFVLWTLPARDTAVASWARLLRPGGVVVAIDAAHFPNGITDVDDFGEAFLTAYNADTQQRLPNVFVDDPAVYVESFRAAGLTDVTVTYLDNLYALDLAEGVAPGHAPIRPFVITGTRR